MIKASVIVATYQRDRELEAALASLAGQTFSDFEIVLVDDNGNSDWNCRVSEVVGRFRDQHPNVLINYIVNPQNIGSAEARNVGIAAAEGEYITFLDDDDLYLPEKLTRQIEFMEVGKFDYSITDLDLYNEKDVLIDKRVRKYIKDTSPDSLLQYHLKYHMTGTDTIMFTKKYLRQIGGFAPINVGDEFYLMQRAIVAGGRFGYLPGCDVKAYVHTGEGGLSSGESKIKGENALYEFKKGYFGFLDAKSKRYIKMRHYAVIAFAEIRRKHIAAFLTNSCRAFVDDPVGFLKLALWKK